MKVADVMTRDVVTCLAEEPVGNVARLMRDRAVGAVVVLHGGRVVGLVTDRRIAVGLVAEGLSAERIPAEAIMIDHPATLSPDDSVFHAIDTLRSANLARRAPVVDRNGALVGIVSISDLAVFAKPFLEGILLEESHHALREVHGDTGGKRIQKEIRKPTREVTR